MTKPKPALCTSTGELFQLVRVHYQVFNQKTVLGVFKKLRCIDFDADRNRWVWLFEHEAKKLRFGKPYNQVPKNMRPIVIGYFTFRGKDQMLLDVRSYERATKAISFFDKRISQRAAKVTYLRIVNKLFDSTREKAQQLIQQSPDIFFDRDDISRPADELTEKIEQLKAEHAEIETRQQVALDWIEQQAQAPLPEVEEIPANFYEDGIEALEVSLNLRKLELIEHWKGNKGVNMLNIIQNLNRS